MTEDSTGATQRVGVCPSCGSRDWESPQTPSITADHWCNDCGAVFPSPETRKVDTDSYQ